MSRVSPSDAAVPALTVVVPTFGRPEQLASCLASLARLDYPRARFEVVVVDDGGRAPLGELVAARRDQLSIVLLRQENSGPGAARNLAATRARGELLAFTDDDCAPAPDWLRQLARAHLEAPEALLGGRTVNALPENLYARTSQAIVDAAYAHFLAVASEFRFFASNNMAVPASAFREIGGFDPGFRTAEDRDLCHRWLRAGRPLVYAREALVEHRHELDLRRFWSQHFGYGRGAHRYLRARAARGGEPFRPDLRFYVEVARRALAASPRRDAPARIALLVLWQAANLAGFLRQTCAFEAAPRSAARREALPHATRGARIDSPA